MPAGPGTIPPQSKLTEERLRKICEGLAQGMSRPHAAAMGGVVYQTLLRWEQEYPHVREATQLAEAQDVARCLDAINEAVLSEDQRLALTAATWKLQNRHNYNAKTQVEHSLAGGDETVFIHWDRLKRLSKEDYAVFMRCYDLLTADEEGDGDGVIDAEFEAIEGPVEEK